MEDFILAFGLLLIIIVCISFLTKLLKQPIIIGYVLAGLFFSVAFAGDVVVSEQIEVLAAIGITLLLFLMGFEFDFKQFKSLGKDISILTLIQTVALFFVGVAITAFFPFTFMERIYLGLAFSLSSTLLVAKWIEDKKETGSLYGKMTLGILVFQDVIAIVAVTFLTISSKNWVLALLDTTGFSVDHSLIKYLASPLLGLILLFAFSFVMARYVLNYALKYAAKSPELLLISSTGVCFGFAIIAQKFGYSESIGAFIAGVVIANTIYKTDISSRLKPLVIFFNMLFFVGLGFQLTFEMNLHVLLTAAVLVVGAIIIKPIIVYVTLRVSGYDLKTSFLASISLAPLSEFGIILIGGGVAAGKLSPDINSIIVLSTIATMLICSYTIKYDKELWKVSQGFLTHVDHLIVKEHKVEQASVIDAQVILFGYYESGKDVLKSLVEKNKTVVVVTNDPDHIEQLEEAGIEHYYGAASTPDFFEHVHFKNVQIVVSSISDLDENRVIIKYIKEEYPHATTVVTAKNLDETVELYKIEADYVIYPTYINEKQVSILLEEYSADVSKMIEKKASERERFQKMIDEKVSRKKNRKNNEFFSDIDNLVGRLSEFQKVNERTIFHLFNKKEQEERKVEKTQEGKEKNL